MFKKGDKIINFSQIFGIEVLVAGKIVEITKPETTMEKLVGGTISYRIKMTPEATAILPSSARNDGYWDIQGLVCHMAHFTEELWQVCVGFYNSRQKHFVGAHNDAILLQQALRQDGGE